MAFLLAEVSLQALGMAAAAAHRCEETLYAGLVRVVRHDWLPSRVFDRLGHRAPRRCVSTKEEMLVRVKAASVTKIVMLNHTYDDVQAFTARVPSISMSSLIWTTRDVALATLEETRRLPYTKRWIQDCDDNICALIRDSRRPLIIITHNEATHYFDQAVDAVRFLRHAMGRNHYVIVCSHRGVQEEKSVRTLLRLTGLTDPADQDIIWNTVQPVSNSTTLTGLYVADLSDNTLLRVGHTFHRGATWTIVLQPNLEDANVLLPRIYRQSPSTGTFFFFAGPSNARHGAPLLGGQCFTVTDFMCLLENQRRRSLPDIIIVLATGNAMRQARAVEASLGNGRDPRWLIRQNLLNILGKKHPFAMSWSTTLCGDDSSFDRKISDGRPPKMAHLAVPAPSEDEHAERTTMSLAVLFRRFPRAGWHCNWQRPPVRFSSDRIGTSRGVRELVKADNARQRLPLILWPMGVAPGNNVATIGAALDSYDRDAQERARTPSD